MPEANNMANVRYMVSDVATALDFYTKHLGFTVQADMKPAFASVTRGPFRILLSGPASSAGRPMPDGAKPRPVAGTASSSSSPISPPKWRA